MDIANIQLGWEISLSLIIAIISAIGLIIKIMRRHLLLEKRMSLLEQEMEITPNINQIHRLEINITRIEGDIKQLISATTRTEQSLERLHEYYTQTQYAQK